MRAKLPRRGVPHVPRHGHTVPEVPERRREHLRRQRRAVEGRRRLFSAGDQRVCHVAERAVDVSHRVLVGGRVRVRELGTHTGESRAAGAARGESDDRLMIRDEPLCRLTARRVVRLVAI